jgi:hypothetical protein
VTTIEAASKLIVQWQAAGTIGGQKLEPARIEIAVMKYLDDARARHLAEATITKLTTIFEKQFLKFAKDHGYRFLKDLTPAVQVLLSPNLHNQDATIVVIDDGEGMDAAGLKQHWLIGISNKRKLARLPRGRQQIGKFGH